ncbi:MAG: geranylgeranyl reductase family protein [Pseudomonadota bacterium]
MPAVGRTASSRPQAHTYDAVVVGGGPCGATAAQTLAERGLDVVLLDRDGRIKPCGGAIPPRLVRDFDISNSQIVARAKAARVISPTGQEVDMPIDGGYVGMVDRADFDEWLRARAAEKGAERHTGTFKTIERDEDGTALVVYAPKRADKAARADEVTGEGAVSEDAHGTHERDSGSALVRLRARMVIGADGANSGVARAALPDVKRARFVFAYHEIIERPAPSAHSTYDGDRCDIYYDGRLSPDFYAWVFPHGETASVGVGSANKGFSLKEATRATRAASGLEGVRTLRKEGAPIPMQPMKRWDNRRDVVVAGDAAGVVAPASGEGIYYAMVAGQFAAHAVEEAIATGNAKALAQARRRFMKAHGRVFWALGWLQYFWYANDKRRERFVSMCRDPDVQRLTWQAYMNKELVRRDPMAHLRVLKKDIAHLFGLVAPR